MSGDDEQNFDFGQTIINDEPPEPEDPVLKELYRRLDETQSPTATLDYLAINVLGADIDEYLGFRNASRERLEWNIRDQD